MCHDQPNGMPNAHLLLTRDGGVERHDDLVAVIGEGYPASLAASKRSCTERSPARLQATAPRHARVCSRHPTNVGDSNMWTDAVSTIPQAFPTGHRMSFR